MADLGKVGIVTKGTWNSSATYEVLDAVSYNNSLYIAKQAVPANTVSPNTTYWQAAVDNSSLLYKAGDSISSNAYYVTGYCAASQSKFLVDIPLSKPIVAGTTVTPTITALVYIPTIAGASVNIFADVDSYTAEIIPSGIRITITMDNSYTMPTTKTVGLQINMKVEFS